MEAQRYLRSISLGFSTLVAIATPAVAADRMAAVDGNSSHASLTSAPSFILAEFDSQATVTQQLEAAAEAYRAGRYAKAESLLREVLTRDLDPYLEANTYERLGEVLEHQGQWEEARAVYQQSLIRDPKRFVALVKMAVALHHLEQFSESQSTIAKAFEGLPQGLASLEELDDYLALAAGLRRMDRLAASVDLLQRAIATNPYLANAAHCDLVADVLQAAGIPAQTTRRLYRSARCSLGFSLPADSGKPLLLELENRIAVEGDRAELRAQYVKLYQQLQLDGLAAPHTLFEPDHPDDRRNRAKAIAYLNLGIGLLNRAVLLGDRNTVEQAVTLFQKSIDADSSYIWNQLYLSTARLLQDRPQAAIELAQGVLQQANAEALPTTPANAHDWARTAIAIATSQAAVNKPGDRRNPSQ